jgi:hypothetical protein
MFLAALGMLMAVAGTLFHPEIVDYRWITIGLSTFCLAPSERSHVQ